MLESKFKVYAKRRIRDRFPELDLDFVEPMFDRSRPDLYILGPMVWAALEFKQSENASHRPNQDYHIARLKMKGYASFVYPENFEEVLDELEVLFTP
jgi:hypothetical protein